MITVKNIQKKDLMKCLVIFAIIQASQINAFASNQGNMEINEPEENKIKVSKESHNISKSKSGCGGIDVEVKAPMVEVKVGAKKANMKVEI